MSVCYPTIMANVCFIPSFLSFRSSSHYILPPFLQATRHKKENKVKLEMLSNKTLISVSLEWPNSILFLLSFNTSHQKHSIKNKTKNKKKTGSKLLSFHINTWHMKDLQNHSLEVLQLSSYSFQFSSLS